MEIFKEENFRVLLNSPDAFINREMSWLCFARRVLNLAEDPEVPLMERVKFAGIMGMIYDEFAMKRLGGLRRLIQEKKQRLSPDSLKPIEELQLCRKELTRQRGVLATLLHMNCVPHCWLRESPSSTTRTSSSPKKQSCINIFSFCPAHSLSPSCGHRSFLPFHQFLVPEPCDYG